MRIVRTEHSELVTARRPVGWSISGSLLQGGDVACAGGMVASYMKKHTCQPEASMYDIHVKKMKIVLKNKKLKLYDIYFIRG